MVKFMKYDLKPFMLPRNISISVSGRARVRACIYIYM